MRRRLLVTSLLVLVLIGAWGGVSFAQDPRPQSEQRIEATVGTAFTYQGRLTDAATPANGSYDFRFRLFNSETSGSQVGQTVTAANVSVTDGLFTTSLDFGNVFDGTALWLEVAVRPGSSSGSFTALDPRQRLSAAP